MNTMHGLFLAGGLAAGMGFSAWLGPDEISATSDKDAESTPISAQAYSELQAARARANQIKVIETKVFESVDVGRSARELIENLKTVKANSPESIQRRSVHYLESLVDLGPKSVPAISAFLRERLDREFLTTRQSLGLQATPFSRAEQLRRGITNPLPRPNLNHVSPPSLRLGCFTVLLQIGGPEAEQPLLEVLNDTASGAEIAWLDEILERLNPGTHRANVLAAAYEILRKPPPLNHGSLLNRQSRRHLIAVLIRHRDLDLMPHFQTHLIDTEGHLDPLAFRYLLDVQGTASLPTLIDLCQNRLKHPDEKRVVRDRLLRFTGTDPAINAFFKETLQAALKKQNGQANRDVGRILMSLNFSPTPGQRLTENPAIIRQRLKLIDWASQHLHHPNDQARLRSLQTTLKRILEPPKENP